MKFSLHERHSSAQYLKKADEIIIEYRDRKAIPDFAEKYAGASLVLEVTPDAPWEISELKDYYILSKERLILCLPDLRDPRLEELKAVGIPFFWGYTITSFWELAAAIKTGACQARIGAPIFFQTSRLSKFGITKRVCVNIAHEGYIPNIDGTIGPWIRPEDLESYDDIFDIVEFSDLVNNKEEALYRIYAEQKEWPGRVDMIISNITTDAYNNMIPKDFAQSRKDCGQRCAGGSGCNICHRFLKLANPELIKEYKTEKEKVAEITKDFNTSSAVKAGRILQS